MISLLIDLLARSALGSSKLHVIQPNHFLKYVMQFERTIMSIVQLVQSVFQLFI
jgi:hypothetical protein